MNAFRFGPPNELAVQGRWGVGHGGWESPEMGSPILQPPSLISTTDIAPVALLVENLDGYANLCRILTETHHLSHGPKDVTALSLTR